MQNQETFTLTAEDGDCRDCKFRGASFLGTRIYCNRLKILVNIHRCKLYEKDDGLPDELLRDDLSHHNKATEAPHEKQSIENESLNKIVDFFTDDCSWQKLRRILTKDVLSTTVLLNYLEHNENAKKRFMNALITMAQNELKKD